MRIEVFGRILALAWLVPAATLAKSFAVYPVGKPRAVEDMNVAVAYFQPIDLTGALMRPAEGTDIHLEADLTAGKNDPDGYAEGDWRPYLVVTYRLTKSDSGQTVSGALMPLVSYGGGSAGKPHYGDNLKLFGIGRYRLSLSVAPPDSPSGTAGFRPFTLDYDFVFAGTGKRGAY